MLEDSPSPSVVRIRGPGSSYVRYIASFKFFVTAIPYHQTEQSTFPAPTDSSNLIV